jgi:hypothetical protein
MRKLKAVLVIPFALALCALSLTACSNKKDNLSNLDKYGGTIITYAFTDDAKINEFVEYLNTALTGWETRIEIINDHYDRPYVVVIKVAGKASETWRDQLAIAINAMHQQIALDSAHQDLWLAIESATKQEETISASAEGYLSNGGYGSNGGRIFE